MILTCRQRQQCEEAAFSRGVTAAALMEEAGRGIADVVRQFAPRAGSLVLFLGKGNNAGDALVAARELVADGWKLYARLSGEPAAMKELPRQHLVVLGSLVRILKDATTFDFPAGPIVSLDGLLGRGAQGPMKPELQVLARDMLWPSPHPAQPDLKLVGSPLRLSATPTRLQRPPPQLDADHAAVLKDWLGL